MSTRNSPFSILAKMPGLVCLLKLPNTNSRRWLTIHRWSVEAWLMIQTVLFLNLKRENSNDSRIYWIAYLNSLCPLGASLNLSVSDCYHVRRCVAWNNVTCKIQSVFIQVDICRGFVSPWRFFGASWRFCVELAPIVDSYNVLLICALDIHWTSPSVNSPSLKRKTIVFD